MQGKKVLFLFLALLLPVSIFVFLKLFGKNEFDVPAFYQDVAPVAKSGCANTYNAPYHVPDSIMSRFNNPNKQLYLIHFSDLTPRLKQELTDPNFSLIFVDDFFKDEELEAVKNCILLVPAAENLVVVDNDGKIRGYYSSNDREEADRLLLELEILLKKY